MEPMNTFPEMSLPSSLLADRRDRFGIIRDLGISTLTYKVARPDSTELFIAENLMHAKGGPPRHMHLTQDEWFFVREGEFLMELGENRHLLKAGDSIWGPRGVPHAWSYISDGPGSIMFVFNPPAKIEAFFEELARLKSPAPSDPEFWRPFEMEFVGPPLQL